MEKKPERRICVVWSLQALLIFSVLGSVLTVGIAFLTEFNPVTVFVLSQVGGVILAGLHTFYRYLSWGFEIKDDHLYLEHGVLRKTYSMVPFVRIQHVDTQRSVFDRVLSLSSIVVYTAGSRGADVAIPGLEPDDADEMQGKLRDEAVESEDSDGV